MKSSVRCGLLVAPAVVVCFGMSVLFQIDAQAQQKKPTALEGIKFETSVSMTDNIKAFAGKNVFIPNHAIPLA